MLEIILEIAIGAPPARGSHLMCDEAGTHDAGVVCHAQILVLDAAQSFPGIFP